MTKLSIITVTYNAARSLQRTLQSVAAQTHPAIEHLIIDGASTDETLNMALRYKAASTHEVVVSSEPDNGLYDAMNKGLKLVTGNYILFLNAGDTLPSADTIAAVAAAADSCAQSAKAPAVIYGDTDIIDNEGHFLRHRRLQPPEHLTWRSFRQGMLVCHQAFYARADLASQTPYDTMFRYSADVDWCIRIMKQAEKEGAPLLNLHTVVANYTEEGQTTQHHRESLWERYCVMQRHYGVLQTFFLHCWFVVRAVLKK